MLVTRIAATDDVPRLAHIHAQAYPVPRPHEFRERRFTHNALGPMSNAWVVEEDTCGDVVAHGFVHNARIRFGDSWVRCGAVASIGVAHEARGRGVASMLLERLHAVSRERGDALTVLYGFREGFYARYGYGRVSSYRRLSFSPRGVTKSALSGNPYHLRAAGEADADAMHAVYTQHAHTGHLERTTALWRERLAGAFTTLAIVHGELGGWVTYVLEQSEPHARTVAHVTDFQWRDVASRARLVEHLAALRDQVTHIEIDVAHDDPLDVVLLDGDVHTPGTHAVEHPLGVVAAGPMVRMASVASLCARRYAADGAVGIALRDAPSGAVSERWRLVVSDGAASLDEQSCEHVIALDACTLARVAFGGVPLRWALACGLAEASSGHAEQLAASMFAIAPYFSYDAF